MAATMIGGNGFPFITTMVSVILYTNLSMAMLQMSCTHFLLLASSCCTNVMATYTALRSSRDFCMLLSSQLVARVMLIGCPSLMTV